MQSRTWPPPTSAVLPSPHVALAAQLPDFRKEDLDEALVNGSVVKATLMRGTLHIVAAEDYPYFAAAWHAQHLSDVRGRHKNAHVDEESLLADLKTFTAQPRTLQDLKERVAQVSAGAVRKADTHRYAGALVPMVHVAPSGHWRSHKKPAMVRWDGKLEPETVATARLVERYLRAYGPASRADIAHFTYLRMRQIDPALTQLQLRTHRAEDGRELLDLADAHQPGGDATLPVRSCRSGMLPCCLTPSDPHPSEEHPRRRLQGHQRGVSRHLPHRRPGMRHVEPHCHPRRCHAHSPATGQDPPQARPHNRRRAPEHLHPARRQEPRGTAPGSVDS